MTAGVLRRGGAAIVAALLAAGALLVAGPPSSASPSAPTAACPAGAGVTVVVDFGILGGGVQVRCVTGPVSSGFDALKKAGFTYAGTTRFPGLLCRIDGEPADDPCYNAPTSDRYWAYWTAAQPDGEWTYSEQGAGNRTPPTGSVEGWAFSDGCDRKPGSGPCPSATTTTRPPTTTTTRAPTHTGGSGGGTGGTTPVAPGPPGGAGPDDPDDPSTTTAAGGAGDASTSTTQSADRAPQPGEGGDDEVAALGVGAATSPRDDGAGGSPVGALVGAAAVLALGGAGAVTARRRHAADEAGSW